MSRRRIFLAILVVLSSGLSAASIAAAGHTCPGGAPVATFKVMARPSWTSGPFCDREQLLGRGRQRGARRERLISTRSSNGEAGARGAVEQPVVARGTSYTKKPSLSRAVRRRRRHGPAHSTGHVVSDTDATRLVPNAAAAKRAECDLYEQAKGRFDEARIRNRISLYQLIVTMHSPSASNV